jgi:hypothetical protein
MERMRQKLFVVGMPGALFAGEQSFNLQQLHARIFFADA